MTPDPDFLALSPTLQMVARCMRHQPERLGIDAFAYPHEKGAPSNYYSLLWRATIATHSCIVIKEEVWPR